ncbi:MAG: TonB-dependent receptor [Cyclobacteriaceae bacterium]|nr:TonB-dependent receptor [Cyclobacteriaceae bacterium]
MRVFILLVGLVLAVFSYAQEITGTVSGKIKSVSGDALIGASVAAYQNSETPVAGIAANDVGKFSFQLAPGRYKLVISFTGYQSRESELLVIAGKTTNLFLTLEEVPTELQEIVVSPEPVNGTGLTSVSIEKTLRVPANFFDPVRMLTSYPGVIAANDQANSIIVKGYSPNYVLWRIEGLDVVNPNHLANAGTMGDKPTANGGGVSILSSQVLDRTDFRSGYLPTGYGNGLAGIMDMKLRAGATDKMQYTAQASLIGLDLAAEGPLNKEKGSSFLVNYRYSTIGLLSSMGVDFGDEAINFQDLTFKVNAPHKNGGEHSVFGFMGSSKNVFEAKPEEEWEEEKDRYDITFEGFTYGVGLVNHFKPGTWNFATGLSFSGQVQERNSQSMPLQDPNTPHVFRESYDATNIIISGFVKANRKLGMYGNLETGVRLNQYQQYLKSETITQAYLDIFTPSVRGNVNGLLLQPYASWTKYVGTWQVNAGLQYARFAFNNTDSWEPKLSVTKSGKNNVVSLSAGTTSQMQQTQNYLVVGSKGIGFTRSHQALAEWKTQLPGELKLTTSAFYHWIVNAPVVRDAPYYSTLNQWDGYIWNDTLVNTGKGRHYGLEASLEKRFYNNLYFILSGSRYEAKFYNGSTYLNSRFNTKFTSSLLVGKEWNKKNRSFGVHARALYLGGLRQPLIDLATSQQVGTTIYNEANGYLRLPDYFRTDLRVSWRKNKPGYTRTLSIDIQNVTSQQNTAFTYFDTFLQKETTKYQLGIIPVLAYRVDF